MSVKNTGAHLSQRNGVRFVLKMDGIIPQNVGVISTKIRAMENKFVKNYIRVEKFEYTMNWLRQLFGHYPSCRRCDPKCENELLIKKKIKTDWFFIPKQRSKLVGIFSLSVSVWVWERERGPHCVCARENELTEIVCGVCGASKCVWEKNTAGSKVKGESMWKQRHQRKKWRDSQEMDKVELWSRWGWLRLQGYILIWNQWSHPPYVPQQDLQQVKVMVKEGAVEVEIEEMDTMNERIKLLSARMDAAEQQGRSLLRGELE